MGCRSQTITLDVIGRQSRLSCYVTPDILPLRLTSFYLGFSPVTLNIIEIAFDSLLFTLLDRKPFHHGLHATPSPRISFP